MDLEALRLQALESLKNARPKEKESVVDTSVREEGGMVPLEQESIVSRPVVPAAKVVKQQKIRRPNRDERQRKKVLEAFKPMPLSPSQTTTDLFEQLQGKMLQKSMMGTKAPEHPPPPPLPVSFSMRRPATEPSFIIDLDSSQDENEVEPGEIPEPVMNRSADNIEMLKNQLEQIQKKLAMNDDSVRRAVETQMMLKEKLKHCKLLISQGKYMKNQLTHRKSELLLEILRSKNVVEVKSTPSIPNSDVSLSPIVEIDASKDENRPIQYVGSPIEPASGSQKRKIEMEELVKQLDKVQEELHQGKIDLLKVQATKRARPGKKKTKTIDTLVRSLSSTLAETSKGPSDKFLVDLGLYLVNVDGNLIPIGYLEQLWKFVEIVPTLTEKEQEVCDPEYTSPLKALHSAMFLPWFSELMPNKGLLSPSCFNAIDPMKPFCLNEFKFGCSDRDCPYQHFKQIAAPENQILESVIQRLLEAHHNEKFQSKAEVLAFIHEKMATIVKGTPIVNIVSKLLNLKDELFEKEQTLTDFALSSPCLSEPEIGKKYAAQILKPFINSMNFKPDRCFFDLSYALATRSAFRVSRYYQPCESEESEKLWNLLTDEDVRGDQLALQVSNFLEDCTSESLRNAYIDLQYALRKPSRFSGGDPWLIFHLSKGFNEKCNLVPHLLDCLTESIDVVELVLGIAKTAIDQHKMSQANALFLAILKSEMSLDSDDNLPTAQLCDLKVTIQDDHLAYLWIIYLYFIQTASYDRRLYLCYPYDCSPNLSFLPLIPWRHSDTFSNCEDILRRLLTLETLSEELKQLASWNLLSLLLAKGEKFQDALTKIPSSIAEIFSDDGSSSINRLIKLLRMKLGSKNLDDVPHFTFNLGSEAAILASLVNNPLTANQLRAIIRSYHKESLVLDLSLSRLLGERSTLEGCKTILHRQMVIDEDGLVGLRPAYASFEVLDDSASISSLTEHLGVDPANLRYWKHLIAKIDQLGFESFRGQIVELRDRFCAVNP